MMSVYKLPTAIHALRQAEKSKLDLTRTINLTPYFYRGPLKLITARN
jgi:hypothetical protein